MRDGLRMLFIYLVSLKIIKLNNTLRKSEMLKNLYFRRSVLIKRTISAFSSGINSPKLHGDTIPAEIAIKYAQSEPCDMPDSKSEPILTDLSHQKEEFVKPEIPTLVTSGRTFTFKTLAHSVIRQMSIHDIEKEQIDLCPKVEGRIFQYDEQVSIGITSTTGLISDLC